MNKEEVLAHTLYWTPLSNSEHIIIFFKNTGSWNKKISHLVAHKLNVQTKLLSVVLNISAHVIILELRPPN